MNYGSTKSSLCVLSINFGVILVSDIQNGFIIYVSRTLFKFHCQKLKVETEGDNSLETVSNLDFISVFFPPDEKI